jgi:hypothetical protein
MVARCDGIGAGGKSRVSSLVGETTGGWWCAMNNASSCIMPFLHVAMPAHHLQKLMKPLPAITVLLATLLHHVTFARHFGHKKRKLRVKTISSEQDREDATFIIVYKECDL